VTRVVIADDQTLVRSGFTMILTAADIEVVGQAANGLEAVAATRRLRPDVVLMDIRMPTLDGLGPPDRSSARHQPPPMASRSGCSC
jgi:YesN/AraC family two-component response regulator